MNVMEILENVYNICCDYGARSNIRLSKDLLLVELKFTGYKLSNERLVKLLSVIYEFCPDFDLKSDLDITVFLRFEL